MHAITTLVRRLTPRLLAALACAACLAPAHAQASFHFVSEPGDFIGKGATQTFSEPDSTFAFSGNSQQGVGVRIQAGGGLGFWSLDFSSGDGQLLQPGTHLFAQRFPSNPSGVPGLSVTGAGSGCNTLTGRFHVSEIERDPSGNITKFAADFEQHCEGADPALFGSVRLNSTAPSLIQRLMNSSQNFSSWSYFSEPGNWVGKGETKYFDQEDGSFTVNASSFGYVSMRFTGPGQFWSMDFEAPDTSQPMQPGFYPNATRWPFNPQGTAGISVFGNGAGCNTITGEFNVMEIEFDGGGGVKTLAIDFEQHCEGGAPALFGSLRHNSAIPPTYGLPDALPTVQPYCFGDVCPCGNGDALGGCANSTGGGATLTLGGGSTSVSEADLDLFVSGLPANQPSMMLVSNETGFLPMGNGALCLGTPLVRLAMAHADERGNIHFAPFDASGIGMVPNLAAGEVLHFQTWYRDAQGPCGAGTNFSNALHAVLKP